MELVALMTLILVVCLLAGIPIAISLGVTSVVGLFADGVPLEYVAKTVYNAVDSFTVIAIPMFILSGAIMERGGLTRRLVDFAKTLVGGSTGGLAVVTVITCALFAAISGSGPATTAAIGSILVPAMIHEGYDRNFAGGVVACSGGIGVVIPPSILMIVYGVSAQVSITTLFTAGFIPGILLAFLLILTVKIVSKRKGYRSSAIDRSWKLIVKAAYEAKWALASPIIILGGIYGGMFTVTEASIVAVLYSLFVTIVVYREFSFKDLRITVLHMARMTGSVIVILMFGTIFGRVLTLYQVPQSVSAALVAAIRNPVALVLLINLMLLFIGMWMESITMIVILVPLLLPVAVAAGIHPIQFGVMFVIACEIGYETPPLGVNLFVASEIAETTIEGVSRPALLLAGAEVVALVLVSLIPQISLVLPQALGML
ncbi:MAG: TRAP transporter large permease [Spirochaetales bacterium]|nr:TRAP transporter large permease [Spirochaetales bacterium]